MSPLTRSMLRQLYVCGYPLEHISEGLGYSLSAMRALAASDYYAHSRNAYTMRRRSMQWIVMDSFLALKAGQKPCVNAREALAYASAYEKLSDAETEVHHLYHAFERITSTLIDRIEQTTSERLKKQKLRLLKAMRVVMEDILCEALKRAGVPTPVLNEYIHPLI